MNDIHLFLLFLQLGILLFFIVDQIFLSIKEQKKLSEELIRIKEWSKKP